MVGADLRLPHETPRRTCRLVRKVSHRRSRWSAEFASEHVRFESGPMRRELRSSQRCRSANVDESRASRAGIALDSRARAAFPAMGAGGGVRIQEAQCERFSRCEVPRTGGHVFACDPGPEDLLPAASADAVARRVFRGSVSAPRSLSQVHGISMRAPMTAPVRARPAQPSTTPASARRRPPWRRAVIWRRAM